MLESSSELTSDNMRYDKNDWFSKMVQNLKSERFYDTNVILSKSMSFSELKVCLFALKLCPKL